MRKSHQSARKVALMALAGLVLSACAKSEPEKLTSLYDRYANAVLDGRGYSAAKLVSANTLQHYGKLRDLALNGGSGMYYLGVYDEVSIYYLRWKFDSAGLSKLSSRDVMNVLVKAGLVTIEDMDDFELRALNLGQNAAWANLYLDGLDTPYDARFVSESGKWKFDGKALRDSQDDVLLQRLIRYDSDKDTLINEMLKSYGLRDGLTAELRTPPAKS